MFGLIYFLLIGWWLCTFLIAAGLFFCCTIIGIPFGLMLIAAGFKALTP